MADIIDINTPGWDGVNADSPLPQIESETFQGELDRSIRRIYESDDGKKLFDWLVGSYLQQPSWAPGYTTDFGFYREGQNTLIRELLMRSERAGDNG
tara:strand:- start:159 stop:449 length:291 start_codon:yes stop_codon:yes gene_type:complete